jgi:hypothetical protein
VSESNELAGHAFISYVREDSSEVDALQQALEGAGVRVWRDTSDLWPGEDWRARIQEAITRNALVFIACFSQRSAAREESYMNEELTLAIEQLRLRRPGVPWLIPVRFDDCDIPDVDLGRGRTMASLQRSDIFGNRRDEAVSRLVAAVIRLLGQDRSTPDTHASSKSDSPRGTGRINIPRRYGETGQPRLGEEPVIANATADRTAGDQAVSTARRRMTPSRHLRSSLALAAAVSAVAIVIAVVLLNARSPGPGKKLPLLSAAAAVAAVQSDRLTEHLLDTPFAASNVPGSTSASASQLSDSMTGIMVHGLMTLIYTKFSGPADDMWVNYYVFDNPGDADEYYSASIPRISGYNPVGQFAGAGIGDPTKCQTERDAAQPQWGWICLTLSSSVVSYSVTRNDTSTDAGLDLVLARDAVQQLRTVARTTARGPYPQPPGSLQPSALLAQVHSPFTSALIPVGLSSPVSSDFTNEGLGLLDNDRVRDYFSGSGVDYTGAEIAFYVFNSSQDAHRFFSVDWVPYENGVSDTQTGNPVYPSGFPASQQAACHTFTVAATHKGISNCYVQWGDVVVQGLTSNTRDATSASMDMALTLARAGLLGIGPAIAS